MRIPALLFIALFIPALIALGHDAYLFNGQLKPNQQVSVDLVKKDFKFSAFGFIWTRYHPKSFKQVAKSLEKEDWKHLEKVLSLKAFHSGLAFAGIWFIALSILGIMGFGPFKRKESAPARKRLKI